jgi:hypothetical protein
LALDFGDADGSLLVSPDREAAGLGVADAVSVLMLDGDGVVDGCDWLRVT